MLRSHRGLAARGLVEEPTAAHRAELAEYLPEVLAIRYPGPRPRRGSRAVDRRVSPTARRRARAKLAELAGHPDPPAAARAARVALSLALAGPGELVSQAMGGIALEVAEGRLEAGWLAEAFERACGSGAGGSMRGAGGGGGPERPGWAR